MLHIMILSKILIIMDTKTVVHHNLGAESIPQE